MVAAPQLTFLGTGSAFPTQSYNSCFILDVGKLRLLVDAGGGNGIISCLKNNSIEISSIRHFFITHSHTDHILGAVWVIRAVINSFKNGSYEGKLMIYGNSEALEALDVICKLTLLPSHYELMRKLTLAVNVENDERQTIEGEEFSFFDVGSVNVKQTGFKVGLKGGKYLVFLGDESITERNVEICRGAEWVVCGAFCRDADADIFKPYEKHHHTVLDVANIASKAEIGTLVLIHAEDRRLTERQALYAEEASTVFDGRVIVPIDDERLKLTIL